MYNSNSDLDNEFLFYRYAYNLDVFCTMKHAINKITVNELTHDQLALIKNGLCVEAVWCQHVCC